MGCCSSTCSPQSPDADSDGEQTGKKLKHKKQYLKSRNSERGLSVGIAEVPSLHPPHFDKPDDDGIAVDSIVLSEVAIVAADQPIASSADIPTSPVSPAGQSAIARAKAAKKLAFGDSTKAMTIEEAGALDVVLSMRQAAETLLMDSLVSTVRFRAPEALLFCRISPDGPHVKGPNPPPSTGTGAGAVAGTATFVLLFDAPAAPRAPVYRPFQKSPEVLALQLSQATSAAKAKPQGGPPKRLHEGGNAAAFRLVARVITDPRFDEGSDDNDTPHLQGIDLQVGDKDSTVAPFVNILHERWATRTASSNDSRIRASDEADGRSEPQAEGRDVSRRTYSIAALNALAVFVVTPTFSPTGAAARDAAAPCAPVYRPFQKSPEVLTLQLSQATSAAKAKPQGGPPKRLHEGGNAAAFRLVARVITDPRFDEGSDDDNLLGAELEVGDKDFAVPSIVNAAWLQAPTGMDRNERPFALVSRRITDPRYLDSREADLLGLELEVSERDLLPGHRPHAILGQRARGGPRKDGSFDTHGAQLPVRLWGLAFVINASLYSDAPPARLVDATGQAEEDRDSAHWCSTYRHDYVWRPWQPPPSPMYPPPRPLWWGMAYAAALEYLQPWGVKVLPDHERRAPAVVETADATERCDQHAGEEGDGSTAWERSLRHYTITLTSDPLITPAGEQERPPAWDFSGATLPLRQSGLLVSDALTDAHGTWECSLRCHVERLTTLSKHAGEEGDDAPWDFSGAELPLRAWGLLDADELAGPTTSDCATPRVSSKVVREQIFCGSERTFLQRQENYMDARRRWMDKACTEQAERAQSAEQNKRERERIVASELVQAVARERAKKILSARRTIDVTGTARLVDATGQAEEDRDSAHWCSTYRHDYVWRPWQPPPSPMYPPPRPLWWGMAYAAALEYLQPWGVKVLPDHERRAPAVVETADATERCDQHAGEDGGDAPWDFSGAELPLRAWGLIEADELTEGEAWADKQRRVYEARLKRYGDASSPGGFDSVPLAARLKNATKRKAFAHHAQEDFVPDNASLFFRRYADQPQRLSPETSSTPRLDQRDGDEAVTLTPALLPTARNAITASVATDASTRYPLHASWKNGPRKPVGSLLLVDARKPTDALITIKRTRYLGTSMAYSNEKYMDIWGSSPTSSNASPAIMSVEVVPAAGTRMLGAVVLGEHLELNDANHGIVKPWSSTYRLHYVWWPWQPPPRPICPAHTRLWWGLADGYETWDAHTKPWGVKVLPDHERRAPAVVEMADATERCDQHAGEDGGDAPWDFSGAELPLRAWGLIEADELTEGEAWADKQRRVYEARLKRYGDASSPGGFDSVPLAARLKNATKRKAFAHHAQEDFVPDNASLFFRRYADQPQRLSPETSSTPRLDQRDGDEAVSDADVTRTQAFAVALTRINGSLGLVMSKMGGWTGGNQVTAVRAGGAAVLAGIQAGDWVTEVDGTSTLSLTAGRSLSELSGLPASQLLRYAQLMGPSGEPVRLRLVRIGFSRPPSAERSRKVAHELKTATLSSVAEAFNLAIWPQADGTWPQSSWPMKPDKPRHKRLAKLQSIQKPLPFEADDATFVCDSACGQLHCISSVDPRRPSAYEMYMIKERLQQDNTKEERLVLNNRLLELGGLLRPLAVNPMEPGTKRELVAKGSITKRKVATHKSGSRALSSAAAGAGDGEISSSNTDSSAEKSTLKWLTINDSIKGMANKSWQREPVSSQSHLQTAQTNAQQLPSPPRFPDDLDAARIFKEMDRDQSNTIERDEFVAFMLHLLDDHKAIYKWWQMLVAKTQSTAKSTEPAEVDVAIFRSWAEDVPQEFALVQRCMRHDQATVNMLEYIGVSFMKAQVQVATDRSTTEAMNGETFNNVRSGHIQITSKDGSQVTVGWLDEPGLIWRRSENQDPIRSQILLDTDSCTSKVQELFRDSGPICMTQSELRACMFPELGEHWKAAGLGMTWKEVTVGLRWTETSNGRPTEGKQISNHALAVALETRKEFTEEELRNFGILPNSLDPADWVKVPRRSPKHKDKYFHPAGFHHELHATDLSVFLSNQAADVEEVTLSDAQFGAFLCQPQKTGTDYRDPIELLRPDSFVKFASYSLPRYFQPAGIGFARPAHGCEFHCEELIQMLEHEDRKAPPRTTSDGVQVIGLSKLRLAKLAAHLSALQLDSFVEITTETGRPKYFQLHQIGVNARQRVFDVVNDKFKPKLIKAGDVYYEATQDEETGQEGLLRRIICHSDWLGARAILWDSQSRVEAAVSVPNRARLNGDGEGTVRGTCPVRLMLTPIQLRLSSSWRVRLLATGKDHCPTATCTQRAEMSADLLVCTVDNDVTQVCISRYVQKSLRDALAPVPARSVRWELSDATTGKVIDALAEIPPPRYDKGQRLLVVRPVSGILVDATVILMREMIGPESVSMENSKPAMHALRINLEADDVLIKTQLEHGQDAKDGKLLYELNAANHCRQRLPSVKEYFSAIASYCEQLEEQTSKLEDGITGTILETKEQILSIGVRAGQAKGAFDHVSDVKGLIGPLLKPSPHRLWGSHPTTPVLVCAEAGTGKTWSSVQLTHAMAVQCKQQSAERGVPLVPVLVFVQRLARMLRHRDPNAPLDEVVLLQYFVREFPDRPEWLSMLTMALEMKALVVVLDGIDEAGDKKMTEQISTLVRDQLVPAGLRVVCTSRPEGVNVEDFRSRFLVLDLKKLSEEQQKKAVDYQLNGNDYGQKFAKYLLSFTKIRKELDRIYLEDAFPSPQEREKIETSKFPNLQFVDGIEELPNGQPGERDKQMRQKTRSGKFATVSLASEPASRYLNELCGVLNPDALARLDEKLEYDKITTDKEALNKEIGGLLGVDPEDSPATSVATKLVLLVRKRRIVLKSEQPPEYLRKNVPQKTSATLWPQIVARTDQIYQTVEDLLPIFLELMEALASEAGLNTAEDLRLAETLKDPVRMHEKAIDDYVGDFEDWDEAGTIPETCVIDILRGRAVCPDSFRMSCLLQSMANGFEREVRGKKATLSLLRSKSKMRHEDPTRLRNILNNLLLKYDGVTTVVEIQVHHRAIFECNESAHAHEPYEFFRSLFADAYARDMDTMLERAILFLEEVSGVPVLLSMLVLIFKTREENSTASFPSNRFELYKQAMSSACKSAAISAGVDADCIANMLQNIAVENHKSKRRYFTYKEVETALSGSPADLAMFNTLLDTNDGVPLVKTLSYGSAQQRSGEFQFRHLSFQEALFVIGAVRSKASLLPPKEFLKQPFYLNACRIGAGRLGDALLQHWSQTKHVDNQGGPAVDLSASDLQDQGGLAVGLLIEECQQTVTLDLSKNDLCVAPTATTASDKGLNSIASALSKKSTLTSLNLSENKLGTLSLRQIKAFAAALRDSAVIECNVRGNELTFDQATELSKTSRIMLFGTKHDQTSVDLASQKLDSTDAILIASDILVNLCDNSLCRSRLTNRRSLQGVDALADSMRKGLSPTLQEIKLRSNGFGVQGWATVFNALCASTTCEIQAWDLRDEKLSNSITMRPTSGTLVVIDLATPLTRYLNASSSVTECNLRGNRLDIRSAKVLADIATKKQITLFGSARHVTNEADYTDIGLKPPDAILVASMLRFSSLTTLLIPGRRPGRQRAEPVPERLTRGRPYVTTSLKAATTSHIGAANHIGDAGVVAIAAALKESKIETLDLSGYIGREGVEALASALTAGIALKKLIIMGMNNDGMRVLGDALRQCGGSNLTALECDAFEVQGSSGRLCAEKVGLGAAALIGGLLKFHPSVAEVSLDGVWLPIKILKGKGLQRRDEDDGAVQHLDSLTVSAAEAKVLRHLNHEHRGRQRFGEAAAIVIASLIGLNANLRSLSFATSCIHGDGARRIADAVLSQPTIDNFGGISLSQLRGSLASLDLASDGVGVPEALVLAAMLRSQSSLTEVNLDGCMLSVPTLKGLHRSGAEPVDVVDLSGAQLGPASAVVIASLISSNRVLRHLNLSNNRLCGVKIDEWGRHRGFYTATGIQALADALCAGFKWEAMPTSDPPDGEPITNEALANALQAKAEFSHKEADAFHLTQLRPDSYIKVGDVYYRPAGRWSELSLISLTIGDNCLGNEGFAALAVGVAQNCSLKNVDMNNRSTMSKAFGQEGAAAWAAAIATSASLKAVGCAQTRPAFSGYDVKGIPAELTAASSCVCASHRLRCNSLNARSKRLLNEANAERVQDDKPPVQLDLGGAVTNTVALAEDDNVALPALEVQVRGYCRAAENTPAAWMGVSMVGGALLPATSESGLVAQWDPKVMAHLEVIDSAGEVGKCLLSSRRLQPSFAFESASNRYRGTFALAIRFSGTNRHLGDLIPCGGRCSPGTLYMLPQSVGPQPESKKTRAPTPGFGTAKRKHVKKVWISQAHQKMDMHGADSPGPAAYALKSTIFRS